MQELYTMHKVYVCLKLFLNSQRLIKQTEKRRCCEHLKKMFERLNKKHNCLFPSNFVISEIHQVEKLKERQLIVLDEFLIKNTTQGY